MADASSETGDESVPGHGGARRAEAPLYEITRWRLDEQLHRVDALDSKIANMFYLIAGLVPLFGALFVFSDTEGAATVLYVLAVVVYFLVVLFTVLAYLGSRWSVRPALSTLQEYADAYDEPTVRRWVAQETMLSISANEPKLRRKGYFVSAATLAFALDAGLLAVAAIVAAVN